MLNKCHISAIENIVTTRDESYKAPTEEGTANHAVQTIAEKASAGKPGIGLQTCKNAPSGKVLKADTGIAENYRIEKESKEPERIVSMYLKYAVNPYTSRLPILLQ